MKVRWIGAALAACVLGGAGAAGAQPAIVDAVQFPAWLERGGNVAPLAPGTVLQARDRLRTGAGARVQVRLGEGSVVKLGERTQFAVERVEARNVFHAALRLIAGALRFTTDPAARERQRDVRIQVKSLMAGIRGTDAWGKVSDERELICLLEGHVAVSAPGKEPVTLDHPHDYYARTGGGAPQIARVDAAELERWSQQTELAPEGPVGRAGGDWRVIAGKFQQRGPALLLRRALRARGYPAEIAGPDDGLFRVQVRGLAGEGAARALMADLRAVPGVNIPTVGRTPAR